MQFVLRDKPMAKKMKVIPTGDRVLIELLGEDQKKSKGGIVIPDTAEKECPERGKVVAVGPGRVSESGGIIPMSVKKGQLVIFSKYGPDQIKVDDKEYYILSESQILAILE